MKNIITLLLITLSLSASAQKGLYLKPSVGVGLSKMDDYVSVNKKDKFITAYSLGCDVGYKLSRIRLQTGLRLMQTGEANEINIPYDPYMQTPAFSVDRRYRFIHVVIPVMFAYQFKLSNRLNLVPTAGAMASYNLAETGKSTNTQEPGIKRRSTEFYGFDRSAGPVMFTFFATAEVGVEYQLSKTIKLHATPAYNRMITNMAHASNFGTMSIAIKPYNFILNLGIVKDI